MSNIVNNPPQNKFFLYARKSTDVEDKQVMSIEAQLVELRELAKRENLEVIEEFVEKQSAKIPGRPIFNSMIDRIEKNEASGILSWHPDRLARNSVDGGRIIYLVDTGRLSALKFNTFWFEPTPQGKFMLSISFSQSKYYVDALSENTKRGHRQRARNGYMLGKAPLGYINDTRNKTIVIDKRVAPIVIKVFEMYSKGDTKLTDISTFLAEKGLMRHKSDRLRLSSTTKILSNIFYYGLFKYDGDIYEGRHDPIVSKKLFDEVQEVLKNRNKQWSKAKIEKIHKPYLGLLKCGECGMSITGEIKVKHYKNGTEGVFKYYRCTKKSLTHKCHQPHYTSEASVHSQLTTLIKNYSLRQNWANKMLFRLEKEESNIAQSSLAVNNLKKKEIESIDIKLKLLLDSYLDQIIDKDSFQEKKLELISQKKTFEEQIINNTKQQGSWIEPMRKWIKEATEVDQIISTNNKEQIKLLAKKIFGSDLYLEHKKLRGDGQKSWSSLRSTPTGRSYVDLGRIELPLHDCQPRVLPLNDRPICLPPKVQLAKFIYH